MKKPSAGDVLATPMLHNDSGAEDIRGYLKALMLTLWEEKEGFSGKRPFGNSSWDGDLEIALVRAGYVKGAFSSDGDYLDECDTEMVDKLIRKAIEAL